MCVSTARRGLTRAIQASVLRQMAVRRMRLAAQAIDDPELDAGQGGERASSSSVTSVE